MPELHPKPTAPRWHLLLPFLLLFLIRVNLPAVSGETYLIHNAIAESILDGNKWGLMALVKIPDVPLVPTLGLCLAKWLLAPLHLNPVACLCALSQTVVLMMLLHAAPKRDAWSMGAIIAVIALPAIPLFRKLVAVNDPNWLSALPFTLVLLQIRHYGESPQLKTLFNIAVCLGVLVFCGPAMLLASLALTAVTAWHATRKGAPCGTLCILLMPVLYALLLWLPWYSASSDNILAETYVAFMKTDEHIFASPFDLKFLAAMLLALGLLLALSKARHFPLGLLAAAAVIPLSAALSNYLGLVQAGAAPCITVLAALAILGACNLELNRPSLKTVPALAVVAMLSLGCVFADIQPVQRAMPDVIVKNTPPPPDVFDYSDAPDASRLAALADAQWQGSRIVIVGKRLTTVVYPDPQQCRFRPMTAFSPDLFRYWASSEQLHLLVPPPDGRFYDLASPLEAIHRDGASYLFPVAQLSNGWQLWRSVPSPQPKQPTPWHISH